MIVRMGPPSKRLRSGGRPAIRGIVAGLILAVGAARVAGLVGPDWPEWGRDPGHTGASAVVAQPLDAILAHAVIDPFTDLAAAETGGELLAHYAVPLLDGSNVYLEVKSGRYVPCDPPGSGTPAPCGPDAWDAQVWGVQKLEWRSGALTASWTVTSDWKPPPGLTIWEPVFHPVLAGDALYVPASGGGLLRVSKTTGQAVRIDPFGDASPRRFVAGGLAADAGGAVFYDVLELGAGGATDDAAGAWLVRVSSAGSVSKVAFSALVRAAPGPSDPCETSFDDSKLPWPPSPDAPAPTSSCGSQRPGLNVVPAIAPDGTIYTVSRAHFADRYAYLVAVHPDLTPAWSASFRGIFADGCGVRVPATGTAGGCRSGARDGVDPATNGPPAGRVLDEATSSPVVLPDGAILYGVFTRYNFDRGHLLKFSPSGSALAAYDFGWDLTPAVRMHDGGYSILIKDNHYEVGSYCDGDLCPPESPRYDVTSLDPNLSVEWKFTNTSSQACERQADGSIVCGPTGEGGFEWCVNQPAVDAAGTVYAGSEDGFLYAIDAAGRLGGRIFLDRAIGAAYTPLAVGDDGVVYAQNHGHLFAVGIPPVRERPIPPPGTRRTVHVER